MTSKPIDDFLIFLRECEQRFHMAEADEQEANGITNDIHHSMELVDHDDSEILQLGHELIAARRQRRSAKDTMNETAPVLSWMDGNRATIKSLENLLGEVRKAERIAQNRIYTPRSRKDAP